MKDEVGGDPYRLPTVVVPSRYELTLTPDLAAATFAGEVVITVEVRGPTCEVLLNAAELHVPEATISGTPASVTLDEPAERCRLAFAEPLPVGPGQLRLRFSGRL